MTTDEIVAILKSDNARRTLFEQWLTGQEIDIIGKLYGLHGEPVSAGQIAKMTGSTRERVRGVERRALRKMRAEIRMMEAEL